MAKEYLARVPQTVTMSIPPAPQSAATNKSQNRLIYPVNGVRSISLPYHPKRIDLILRVPKPLWSTFTGQAPNTYTILGSAVTLYTSEWDGFLSVLTTDGTDFGNASKTFAYYDGNKTIQLYEQAGPNLSQRVPYTYCPWTNTFIARCYPD